MPTEQFANNASSTLTAGINAIQTSLTISSNDNFPSVTTASTDFFYITIGTEVCKVTNNPTTTWTVSRGEQGSTATTHSASDVVYCVVTKQSMIDIQTAAASGSTSLYGTYAALPAAGTDGQWYYTSDSVYSFRWNGVDWQAFAFGRPVTRPPSFATFAWLNQGSSTVADSKGLLNLTVPGAAGVNVRGMLKSYTAPFTLEIGFLPKLGKTSFNDCGILLKNSGGAPLIVHDYGSSSAGVAYVVSKFTSTTVFSASYTGGVNIDPITLPFYLRYTDDNTNRIFEYSFNQGVDYITSNTMVRTDFITPNQIGFYGQSQSAAVNSGLQIIHWKES